MIDVDAEMPRYRCHKIVYALKLTGDFKITPEGDAIADVADGGYAPILLKKDVTKRYFPQPGDYFVVYEDGYQSISPQKAFEDGYTRI